MSSKSLVAQHGQLKSDNECANVLLGVLMTKVDVASPMCVFSFLLQKELSLPRRGSL